MKSLSRRTLVAMGTKTAAIAGLGVEWARAANAAAERTIGPEAAPVRIAFGACARENAPQPVWDAIIGTRPQLMLMIGDNIYADTDDMALMRAKYAKLAAQPGFARLRESCPILATWDDHDYGRNDAGVEFPAKAGAQKEFADFFGLPADAWPRKRAGVYDAHTFGPVGRRVRVILLDTRYFRSNLVDAIPDDGRVKAPYRPNDDPAATVLGEPQWRWLEATLREPADLRIIATSIQFVSDRHDWEKWGNFPRERRRLIDLIASTGASGVVFISGDRHLAELSKLDTGVDGAPYPLLDLTCSGLNQGGGGRDDEPNPYRVGRNFRAANFGTIAVDFDAAEPTVTLNAHDVDGKVVITQTVKLADLKPAGA